FERTEIHVITRRAEPGGFRPVDADLLAGPGAVFQKARLEGGVCPCLGDQTGARGRSDRLGPFCEPAMILRGKEAILDRKLPQCNFENFEVSYFFHRWRRFMLMAAASVFVCCLHVPSLPVSSDPDQFQTGSSHRSGSSVCNVSFSHGYSSQRSFWRNRTM